MLNIIKTLVAVVLVVCLFLPLSSCQYQNHSRTDAEPEVQTEYFYVVIDKEMNASPLRFIPAAVFCLPFLLSLVALMRKKVTIKENLMGIISASFIASYIMAYHYLTALEVGGYLAITASLLYLLLSVIGTIIGIRLYMESKRDHHSL